MNGKLNAIKNLYKSILRASIITIEGPMLSVRFSNPITFEQF